jgi:tRNA A37 methylthiotransferase MiaB
LDLLLGSIGVGFKVLNKEGRSFRAIVEARKRKKKDAHAKVEGCVEQKAASLLLCIVRIAYR